MKYRKEYEEIIAKLKKYNNDWKTQIEIALKDPLSYDNLKGNIYNYYVYAEILRDDLTISEIDYYWLLQEIYHGKFKWLFNEMKNNNDPDFELFVDEYNKLGKEAIESSSLNKKYGKAHEKINDHITDALGIFGIYINNDIFKYREVSNNTYEITGPSKYYNPLFLEQYALEILREKHNYKKLCISNPASHSHYINGDEGFSFFVNSQDGKLYDGLGLLYHFLYDKK